MSTDFPDFESRDPSVSFVTVPRTAPRGPIVFFGTPEFAVPTLEALCAMGRAPALVVTQPSRPVGRGRNLQLPPIGRAAERLELTLAQPERVKSLEFLGRLEALEPWLAVVVAFGQIFPQRLLDIPEQGCINLHASLLPDYRGAAPIQAAIADGITYTGVTTMQMTAGLDSGPILMQRELVIGREETTSQLAPRLAELGAELMFETVELLESDPEGRLERREQDDDFSTYAPKLSKEDGMVQWQKSAVTLYNRYRAYTPWPGLTAALAGEPIKLLDCALVSQEAPAGFGTCGRPGTILGFEDTGMLVECGGQTVLAIGRLQRSGRKALPAREFANGERLEAGGLLEDGPSGASSAVG